MTKNRHKQPKRMQWDDYDDSYETDYRGNKEKRREKRMRNLIRSKNVDRLLDMDDDSDYEWGKR